jgi:hypothetical protein
LTFGLTMALGLLLAGGNLAGGAAGAGEIGKEGTVTRPVAEGFPQAEIASPTLQARLYLPDPEKGYYRGTRFDWSGVIASLRYRGHEYFGEWFARHDATHHDAITGPVEEFRVGETTVGYEEAKPGESFLQIGVGTLRRPDEPAYRRFDTYELVDPGEWGVVTAADRVELTHVLHHPAGWAYRYTKVVRLEPDRPELVLEHRLENTGTRTLAVSVYDHNFFVIDAQPTGPDLVVTFPFEARAIGDLKGLAELRGRELRYLRGLREGETAMTEIEGFGRTAADYDLRVENRKTGAGVRLVGDRPISKIIFWSIRTTLCPEPYIDLEVAPGQETRWTLRYQLYTLEP